MQKGAGRRGLPALPAVHVELRPARDPAEGRPALLPAARARPRHGPDRLREVDVPGLHDRAHQQRAGRPHRDHRRPDRVLSGPPEIHHQPARAFRGHPVLRERPQVRPARGPGRRARRRDAGLRDGRGDPPGRGNGAPDLLDAPHELGRRVHHRHHRHLPVRSTSPRSGSCCR